MTAAATITGIQRLSQVDMGTTPAHTAGLLSVQLTASAEADVERAHRWYEGQRED